MKRDPIKTNGVHYTPPDLAAFLANAAGRFLSWRRSSIHVLDPACGNGSLLRAFVDSVPDRLRKRITLTGFETDAEAVESAEKLLISSGVAAVELRTQDFLSVPGMKFVPTAGEHVSYASRRGLMQGFDAVIANPPYVRTQLLGAETARRLAKRFGLVGRVDLYQAFTRAIANVLKPGGVLGLLTSNRFLTIQAGESVRRLLSTEFDLRAICDLGDTKLFGAAVLPAIVIATKRDAGSLDHSCTFDRIYKQPSPGAARVSVHSTVLHALADRRTHGAVRVGVHHFWIERGILSHDRQGDEYWTLSTPEYDAWLRAVGLRQDCTFDDVAKIRVGIKTTADDVFVRTDWENIPASHRPEPELLFPLITHHDAGRWSVAWSGKNTRVLYPHRTVNSKCSAIRLNDYGRARAYFKSHEERLRLRHYVTESGRQWYEVWVPHNPADWSKPKIVFPDISERPRFFLDESGAIIQGDCYWITLKPGADPDWLFLILAVANSTFITKFYDISFHNKLYSGRRRFMTQYVKRFPLPSLRSGLAQRIVQMTRRVVQGGMAADDAEQLLDELVWKAFGLSNSCVPDAKRSRPVRATCKSGSMGVR